MLKLYMTLFFVFITISSVLTKRGNTNITTTTSNPLANILSKFHQNDYKLSYEWSEVVRGDQHFGTYEHHIFKYNRTTTAVNVTFHSNFELGYDMEGIAQAYRFASNEYRLFPMRFQFNFCNAVATAAMGLHKLSKCGNFSCPILKGGTYHYCNWNPEETHFPPFIPAGKYMMELQMLYHSNEFLVTRSYASIYRPIPYD